MFRLDYRSITDVTEHGGTIEKGSKVIETAKRSGKSETHNAQTTVEYGSTELDRSIVNKSQIREVLMAYKKAIYEDLYPEREKKWEYIPKTLIFAKSDSHATDIVEIANNKIDVENNPILRRITYIVFPVWDLKGLVEEFQKMI